MAGTRELQGVLWGNIDVLEPSCDGEESDGNDAVRSWCGSM